ncbi:hypothetical protein JL720_2262 [Aureococcus anophagefferens]|nr:hypothetical protein JL720_2262 [Aureococcus anophagefferens]
MPGSQVVPHHSPRGHRETAAEFAAHEAQAHAMHEKMERVKSMAARRKPDKEERSGWGCSTVLRAEDAGFDRPLAWSWVSVGALAAASYYGGARYLDLLTQDVYGGVRCASCDLRPGRLEIFVLWAVGLNAVLNGLLRVTAPKTMYEPKLWVALDLIDLGCVLGVAYPRILEAEGYAGTKVGGYSMFILFGVFRFLRGLRFERFVLMRYGYVGVPSLRLNGVYVRFITLLFKMIFIVLSMGALISCAEYPCGPNAVRHDRLEELGNCNIAFRSYDRCIYFLIVTFSTVGYGDMYPATQVGRFVIIVILVFVLCFLPDLLGDIAERSDGDDMSNDDKIIASVGAAWEEIVQRRATSRGALRDGFAAARSDAEYALGGRDIQRRLAVLEDAAHERPPAYAPARPSPRAPAAARDAPAAPESPELPARPPPSAAPHPALASPFALPLPWYFAPPPDGDADRFREPLRARRRSPRSKRKPARERPLRRCRVREDRAYRCPPTLPARGSRVRTRRSRRAFIMSEGPGNASRIARWEEKKARAAARRAEQQRQDSQQARQTGLQQVPGMAVPHRVDMFTKASGMVEAPRHDDPFAPALAPEPAEPSQPPRRRPSSRSRSRPAAAVPGEDRRRRVEADRADDARVAREAAQLRRQVDGEVEQQRSRERSVQAREEAYRA